MLTQNIEQVEEQTLWEGKPNSLRNRKLSCYNPLALLNRAQRLLKHIIRYS